jgi:hypothetical protein
MAAATTSVSFVELFHLLVLSHLGQTLDKRFYALKGGCNLRFFLKSIRYSEDMDFDVQILSSDDLSSRVERLLNAKSFRQALAVRQLAIEHVTPAKQTEITQRWKFGLLTPADDRPLPTKIEFSRRRPFTDAVLEAVDPAVLRAYGLPPLLASHYPPASAWAQKVHALAGRAVTQARDIFDLHLLLATGAIGPAGANTGLPSTLLQEAEQRCLSLRFADFKAQVLAFLPPDQQSAYDHPDVWETMALNVAEALRGGHEKH